MTKGKLKFTKRAFAMAMSLSMVAPMAVPAIPAMAEIAPSDATEDEIANAKADEGYELVWHDEFDGDTLNTDDWNVELHEPGWVNAELQRYSKLDEGNIEVSDGALHIYPKAVKKEKAEGIVDAFEGNGIDSNWIGAGASISNGKATINVTSIGSDPWDVQFQRPGLTLTKGHKYKYTVKAKAEDERMIALNVGQSYGSYASFGSNEFTIGPEETECSIEFTMGECEDAGAAAQVNLGNFKDKGEGLSALTTVEVWDATLIDLTASGSSATVFDSFDDWIGAGASVTDGVATIDVTSIGSDPWDVQYQMPGLTLTKGHEYKYTLTASAAEERMIALNVGQSYGSYASFGSNEFTIGTTPVECSITFTMGECEDGKATAQVNLGNFKDKGEGLSALTTVTLSNVSLVDLTAQESGGDEVDPKTDYDYTSGRINTQNKHDFVYGYFESRIRVPEGKGYLPAFWLMATSEDDYGQWPKCGEVDIMEVKGQDTSTSLHTIHYGYTAETARENQGDCKAEEGHDFYDEYHVFAVDWEPGLIVWYVDGEEVHRVSDWYTGKDEYSQLTYPAPFDHEFYVILNLAVGGSWVGYPDQDVVDDMENQSMDVDYVRVYRKDAAYYENLEATCEAPEHESNFREPDSDDNYVVNSKFTEELKEMNSKEDNWELHLEKANENSTYTRGTAAADAISISQDVVGDEDYSCQLKQGGVPMYRGWEYELSFDAWAAEPRTMIVEVEGPDNGWIRYFDDTDVELTTTRTHYSYTFTMEKKTDANGSVEFNLGNQDSTATVHIANVQIKHKSGEEIIEEFQKEVAADGNYILNGSFDQGEDRLGYWEVAAEDEANVSVTNVLTDEGRVRELQAKVEIPEGTSELNPVVISQSELAPVAAGNYEFSFDAYTEDGPSMGLLAVFAGEAYIPALTNERQNFTYSFVNEESLSREDSYVEFIFTRPGTYYLDNVIAHESAMIKNGSFESGFAGYEMGTYGTGNATFGVDSQKTGNNTAFDADIKDSGDADWNIQLKQRGIKLKEGSYYKLTYKAKATVDRKIGVVMQRDGSADGNWAVYSGDNTDDLVSDWTDFELFFQMTDPTDEDALLSITFGTIGDRISDVHHVYMDDFVLVETDAEGNPVEGEGGGSLCNTWVIDDETGDMGLLDADGEFVTDGWKKVGINEYLFDEDGCLQMGWSEYNDKVYYIDPITVVKATKWQEIEGKRYYFGSKGAMAIGWKQIKDKWYYFDEEGAMVTGWLQSGSKWYYLSASGAMVTGWKKIDKKWYFFAASGAMATGWKQIEGEWYYFATSGAMVTGWKKVQGKTYYFAASGAMASAEFVKSDKVFYWVNKDGSWTDESTYKWTKDAKTGKWWFGNSTWYAVNETYTINGKDYNFDKAGWCTNP